MLSNCVARESNQLILKEINPEYSLEGLTDVKTETPILWPPDMKSRFIGKDPITGKESGQGQEGATEDVRAGWPHLFKGHWFEQTPADSEGQGSLACCSPGVTKSQTQLEQLNDNIFIEKKI